MDKNGKQVPTQSSHLGWLKTAFSWLFRTGDQQHEDFDGREGDTSDKKRQDEDVLSPVDPDAASDNADLPEITKQQRNPETTTLMPAKNTIMVRDISPIRNEAEEMEVDEKAIDKNGSGQDKNMKNLITVQEGLERAQVIENNVVPQLTSNMKRLVPGSSTESWVSPTILHRPPPPAVRKLGDTTQMMSVLPTPPNSRIKPGPPRSYNYNPPNRPLTKSPFFKNFRNPQHFETVLQRKTPFETNQGSIFGTTSALDSLANVRAHNPNPGKGVTDGGIEEVEENEQRRDFGKRINHGHKKQQMQEPVGKLEEGNDESEKNTSRPSTSSAVAGRKHVGAIVHAGSKSILHVPSLISSNSRMHEQHGSYNERTINLDNKSGPRSALLSRNEANIPISNVSQLTIQKEKNTCKNVKETNNVHDNTMSSTQIQDANNGQEISPDGIFSFSIKSSNLIEHNQIPIGIQEDQLLQQVDEVPRFLINGQQNLQNIEARLATNHGVEEGAIQSTSENQLTLQQDEEEEKEIGMIPGRNGRMGRSAENRIENEESGNERAGKQSDRGSDDLFNEIGEDKQHASGEEQKSARIQPEKATFQEKEALQDVVIWDGFHEIGDHFVSDFNDLVSEPLSNSEDACVTKLNLHGIHCEQESNDVKEQEISRELLQERNHIEEEIRKLPETQEYVNLHFKETINNVEEEITGIPLPMGNTLRNMETLNWQNVQETNQSANQNVNAKDESSNIIQHDRIIEAIRPEPNIQQVLEALPFLQLHNQQNHENIESQPAANNRMANSLPDVMRNEILPTQSVTQVSRESSPSTSKDTTLKRKRNDLKDMYKTRTTNLNHNQKPKSQQASVTHQIEKQTNQDAREVDEPETKNLSSNQENVSKKQKVDSKNASAFLCGICGQTFKNENGYKLHEIRHEGEEPYKFKCPAPKCDKRFLDERKMKRHIVNHTKNIRCMDCNMSFASQSNLNQHKTIHTGERPFICEYCGTRLTRKYKLQDHLRIHTGERPYTCNDCDQTFKTSSGLYRHMETHSRGRPYSCDVCHKSFTRKCTKTLHMITHSGVRPYTCDVCDKSFTQKGSKTRHMKQFHKNQQLDTNEGKDIEPQPCASRGSNNICNSF